MAVRSKSKKHAGASPRRMLAYVGIAVAAGALLFAAFGLDSNTGPSVEEVAGSPTIEGDALPTLTDSGDTAVGNAAPLTAGASFGGDEVTVGDGGRELLVFLASWCPHCQAELPELVEWMQAGGVPDDVELTAVITGLNDAAPNWPPQAWLEREGYDGRVLVDDADGSVAAAYGMSGTPFFVALRDGEVLARAAGQQPIDVIEQLVAATEG